MFLFGIFLLLAVQQQAESYKFLLYNPKSTRSHVLFMNKIADVLVEGGHDVVVYMPEVEKGFGSAMNHKKARIVERPMDFEPLISVDSPLKDEWNVSSNMGAIWGVLSKLFAHFVLSCEHQLQDEKLIEQLRKEDFDLALTEVFDPCGMGFFEKVGIKKIILMHTNTLSTFSGFVGIPVMPSFNPSMLAPELPPFSFMGRVKAQLIHMLGVPFFHSSVFGPMHDAFKRNGVNLTLTDFIGKASYWFENTDELVNFPAPISHKVINIAGVGLEKVVKRSGQLDKKIQSIFDNSKRGVIYISFGSVAKSFRMPPHIKQAFVEAIKQFPDVNFIWKYEKPEDRTIEKLPNLHLDKWLPQTDILSQKKLIAFLTHSGMNSITEATYIGAPLICIPLFTDQPRNALMVKYRKTAVVVNKHNITKESLVEAFRTMITDKSYYNNAKELAQMIAEKPMKVDERVLKYSEFAAKFNVAEQLDMPGRSLSTIEFYNLDAIAFIFVVIFLTFYILYKLLRFFVCLIFKRLFRQSKKTKSD